MYKIKILLFILFSTLCLSCVQKREKKNVKELQREFNEEGMPKKNWILNGKPKSLKVYAVKGQFSAPKLEWEAFFNQNGQLIYKRGFLNSTSYDNPSYEVRYTYDNNDCLLSTWFKEGDATGTSRFEFDNEGRPSKEFIERSSWLFKQIVEYSYDEFNYIATEKVVSYNGKEKSDIHETKYKYDFKNRRINEERIIDGVFDYENIYKYSNWDWPVEEIRKNRREKKIINYKIEDKPDGYLMKTDSTVTFYNLKKQRVREVVFKGDATLSSYEAKFNNVTGLLESEKSYNGSYTSEEHYTYDRYNNWIENKSVVSMSGSTPIIYLNIRKIEYY